MKNIHELPRYLVEFNGSDYEVSLGFATVAVFSTIDAAFEAKRSFEDRPHIQQLDKTPPAMRNVKNRLYGFA